MIRLLRRLAKGEPVETWSVQFEEGGQIYTYRRRASDFTREMEERYLLRDTLPHLVQVVRGGQVCTVDFKIRRDS